MTPPDPSGRDSTWRPFVAYGVTFAATLILFGGLGMLFPQWREALCGEDGPIQDLTVLILLLGGVVSLATIPSARRRHRSPVGSWAVAGLCIFGALEELSYGLPIFPNLPLPTLLGVRVDAVHDLLEVGKVALGRIGVGRGHVRAATAVMAPLLILLRRDVWAIARALSAAGSRTAFIGVAIAVGLLAQAMDVFRWSMFMEETLELEAAWAMLFAALAGTTLWTGSGAIARPEPAVGIPQVPGQPFGKSLLVTDFGEGTGCPGELDGGSAILTVAHVGDLVVPCSVVAGVRRSTRLKVLRDQKFGAQRLRTRPQ